MKLIELVISQGTGLFGTYYLYQLIETFIPVKQNRFLQFWLFLVTFFAISVPIYPNDAVNVSGIFLAFTVAFFLFLKGPLVHKITLVLALYPFIVAVNFLLEDIGLRLWQANGEGITLDLFLHGVAHLLRGLIWYGMYHFFRHAIPYTKTQITKKLWLILDMICLTPLVAMISFIIFTPTDTRMIYPASFACIVTSICSLYMTGHVAKSFRYKLENQNLQLQKEYYQELEGNQQQLRKIHHDMNNHFSVMLNMIRQDQPEQAEKYLANLTQQHNLSNRIFCKNTIVNAVLNAKYQLMQEYQIDCSMQLDIDTMITLDDISLCSLFGNTLDNAIEAANQAENKVISMKARYYNGFFSYEIKNTKKNKIQKQDARFYSTKAKPQEHGIGLQSVRSIVESYDGTLDINYDEEHFSLVVLINNI
ncbi:sensor histidine kinase [Enterococcus sp. DIV0756]|uniref:sensor histidine kinase n=1 Tax=Enterococcus sp. DIV0756 TaxID=2774636 RepID=UPI003F27A6CA